jgi:hypothetical protein
LLTRLEAESGRRIEMHVNRNRVSYVSFQEVEPGGAVRLRLQRAFLRAPEEVLRSLGRWVGRCRGRCPAKVRSFISACAARDPTPPRPARIRTRGRHHDLAGIMSEVNRACFRGALRLRITWGPAIPTRRRVRQRQLGSCDRDGGLIRISRVLDQPEVPRFFVAFVVFHEMLHAVQPPGSRRDHGPDFVAVERMHPDYARAVRWQKRNLGLLMQPGRHRRTGPRPASPATKSGPVQGVLF